MPKLNQIVAVANGVQTRTFNTLKEVDHNLQRKDGLSGLEKTYTPRDDEGEQLPSEVNKLQVRVDEELAKVQAALTNFWDVSATREYANTEAKADVVVDDRVLLAQVPVTYLLFLEKQLENIRTFVARLPTLSGNVDWTYNENVAAYVSAPVKSTRTAKRPRHYTKWEPPSPEYTQAPQVELWHEDYVVGDWTRIQFSGAIPAERVREMVARVEKLQRAVKFAREEANSASVTNVEIGGEVFGYIFG